MHDIFVSTKRNRFFFARAAREHLATDGVAVRLSALKGASQLAVALALSLQEKKVAFITEVMTEQLDPERSRRRGKWSSTGIKITLSKHPEFRGTRLNPRNIFFCPDHIDEDQLAYPAKSEAGVFAAVVSGTPETLASCGHYKAVLAAMEKQGVVDPQGNRKLQDHIVDEALKIKKDIADPNSMQLVGKLADVKSFDPSLKAIFLHVAPSANHENKTGMVFIEVLDEAYYPHGQPNNAVKVTLTPPGTTHESAEQYVKAVEASAFSLMKAMCEFNAYCISKTQNTMKIRRIAVARVPLISAPCAGASEEEVSIAMLKGLDAAYQFSNSPKLQFVELNGKTVLQEAWKKFAGVDNVQISDNAFARR